MKNWSVIAAAVLLHSTFGSAERQISIHEGERALTAEEKAAVAKEDLSMPSLETSMSMDTADNLWYWNWGGKYKPSPHPTHAPEIKQGEDEPVLPQYRKLSSTCLKAADEEFCKDACFEPVNSNGCPKSANEYLSTVVKKCTNNVKDGELCEADSEGKCNTSDHVDNCSIEYNGNTAPISIYRRVACCDQRSDVQKSHALPAEITAALENAGVEVFNVPLDEVIGIVGNIVGEAIEIPSDATTSEIHSEIIAALDKTGINVPEVA